MKAFEGGRHDCFWLIVAGGFLLLALGAIGLARTLSNKAPMRPSSIGMTIGVIALLLLAWASGGEMTLLNPVIYLAIFTTIVWFT
ncbi:ABC transporter permease, partial [Rhizobium ruizarguesonis]